MLGLGCAIAVVGFNVRPASDDYRLIVMVREGGIPGICWDFYTQVTGRVSNGLLAGLIYSFPTVLPRLLPPMIFLAFALVVGLLIRALFIRANARPRMYVLALAGLGVASITLLGQPLVYQTLFWTPGVITHTIPPIVIIGLVAVALDCPPRRRLAFAVAVFILSVVLAMMSEAITVVWFVLAALLGLTHVLFRRRPGFLLRVAGLGVAGFTLGTLVLWTAPGNQVRQEGVASWPGSDSHPLSADVLADALSMAATALQKLVTDGFAPAAVALGAALAILNGKVVRRIRPTAGQSLWMVAGPIVAVVASAFAVEYAVRYGYGDTTWVVYRVWLNFAFVLVLCFVWLGFVLAGRIVRGGVFPSKHLVTVLSYWCLILALTACTVRLHALGNTVVERAVAWDLQDAEMAQRRAAGERVLPYRPLPIQNLAEPFVGSARWVIESVAGFYQVDAIAKRGS